jgi:hypothetical protein
MSQRAYHESIERAEQAENRGIQNAYTHFAHQAALARAEGERTAVRSMVIAMVPRQVTTTKRGWRDVTVNVWNAQAGQMESQIRRAEVHEETTREEFSVDAAKFMLTHGYGWKAVSGVEVSGPDGGPVDVRAEASLLLARLDGYLEGREDARAEVVDVPPPEVS